VRELKRCLSLILLFLLFSPYCLAFEPELILQIPVGKDNTINGNPLRGKLILASPGSFSVLTPQGKKFYQGSLKPNQGLVSSEDGNFFGIITYSESSSPGILASKRFELYTADGGKLWEIENPGVSSWFISRQARLVVGISSPEGSSESKLVFYDDKGALIFEKKVKFPQEISFSPNGKFIFVNSARDGLLCFDDSGELKAGFGACEKFATSPDGEYVATISAGNLKIYKRGKLISSSARIGPLVRALSFSPESKYLSLIDKKTLYLFEVSTGRLLLRYALSKPELSFISLDVSGNAEKIIAGIDMDKGRSFPPEQRHTRGLVYIFDRKGKLIWKKRISYTLWGALFPRVQISVDGKRFCILTREKVYTFKSDEK